MRVALTIVLLLALLGLGAYVAMLPPPESAEDPGPGPPVGADGAETAREPQPTSEWAGSESCKQCHKELHARWAKTTHALTIREFRPEMSAVPYDGTIFRTRGIDHRMGPGAVSECEGPGGERAEYPVGMVIGLRRIQMFTTRFPGGRIQVLPVFAEVPKKKWFDHADFIFGGPSDFEIEVDGPNSWYLGARNFNSRCGRCHSSNYETGYDVSTDTYDTKWSELVVACESCHGPGGPHVDHHLRESDGVDPIVNPAKLPTARAVQACGQCHSENIQVVPGFRPGDDLFAFMDVLGLEDQKHLYPDGRAAELIHAMVQHMESRCGPMSCTKCHDPHGSGNPGDIHHPLGNDRTCTQCHDGFADQRHTHHAPQSEGSRCVNCHMPGMLIEGGHGTVRDHTISIPSILNTRRHLSPNACRNCHSGEDPETLAGWFAEQYPGAEDRNHRVALAQTVADGRAGKPEAKEALLELLKDENPIYRAGAAWMLSQYDVELTEQLKDKHPMVRRAATKGVAAKRPAELIPLLDDPNMVVRRAAAFSLSRKYELLDYLPELRDKLILTMQAFAALKPDDAALYGAIAQLREHAGRIPEAIESYKRYLQLTPWNQKIRDHVADLEKR